MPKSDFVFGTFDTSTSAAYYKLQPINFPTPEKDVETFEVPGRSGDLLIDYGSYKNVELTVEIAIDGAAVDSDFLILYDALRAAIMVQNGYQRLEDSLYPNEYRVARAVKCERDQSDTQSGKAILTFDAKPQRYLTSGETVALTVEPTPAGNVVTYGIGSDIIVPEFFSQYGLMTMRSDEWAVIDLSAITGAHYLRVYYTTAQTSVVPCLYVNQGSVLISENDYHGGNLLNYMRQADGQTIYDFAHTPNAVEVVFPRTNMLRWEVSDTNDNILSESAGGSGTLTPAAGVMDFSPLIDIEVPGEINARVAVIGDAGIITFNTPATINDLPITDVLIDCETLNAYTIINNAVYNLNPYVTLEGDFVLSGNASTVISIEGGITALSVIPKWWKL